MPDGKLWTQRDHFGNDIYLTRERWAHIIDPDNHPELEPYLDYARETLRTGRRRQDPFDPQSYLYYRQFPDLPEDNTHMVVAVKFRWATDQDGTVHEEKFVKMACFQTF